MVPRPPTLNFPKRANGVEQVVMLGVTLRITITLAGSAGTSLDVMVFAVFSLSIQKERIPKKNKKQGPFLPPRLEKSVAQKGVWKGGFFEGGRGIRPTH